MVSAAVNPWNASAQGSQEPCSISQKAYFDTHMALYNAFHIERSRTDRYYSDRNARSQDALDQLFGGMAEEAAFQTTAHLIATCPATVERIARGAGPLSNVTSLEEVLMGFLLLQDEDIGEVSSEMTSPEFLDWLSYQILRSPPPPQFEEPSLQARPDPYPPVDYDPGLPPEPYPESEIEPAPLTMGVFEDDCGQALLLRADGSFEWTHGSSMLESFGSGGYECRVFEPKTVYGDWTLVGEELSLEVAGSLLTETFWVMSRRVLEYEGERYVNRR